MDQQKDIAQKDHNSKGHTAYGDEMNNSQLTENMNDSNGINSPNTKSGFVTARAEKLVTATYMVTDLIPATDPIKTKIKECALVLLSDIYAASSASHGERALLYRKAISAIGEICGLLGVASSVGFVSGMNYSILRAEYSNLRESIEGLDEIKGSVGRAFTFEEGFFSGDNIMSAPVKHNGFVTSGAAGPKGQNNIKDKTDDSLSFISRPRLGSPRIGRTTYDDNKQGQSKDKRRADILRVLKKKKDVTIKDISQVIPDCSEKTIQRELLSLVANGVLKKEGEKRWSRYSLN